MISRTWLNLDSWLTRRLIERMLPLVAFEAFGVSCNLVIP